MPGGRDLGAERWERAALALHRPRLARDAGAVVQQAAEAALAVIEPIYGMSRPAADDTSWAARNNRATYELHDHAGEWTSVLFVVLHNEFAPDFLQGASIFPAVQNFYLAARAQGLGACPTSWAAYDGEQLLREAIGIPDGWVLAGHIVVGWPRGHHGPVRRRPVTDVVSRNSWDRDRDDIIYGPGAQLEAAGAEPLGLPESICTRGPRFVIECQSDA